MSRCAELMSCKCLRASPWKKSLKGLYPTQYSGYERDLEAQNAEELAKLALRNEKLFTPISNALVKNINRDLRKEKYGYVSIGISAFVALVDMCHDNLYRFESSVFTVLGTLLKVDDVGIRVDAMNLLIKLCQYKEQNDDSSNSKYFEFLDSILRDCDYELETFDETVILKETCVHVLYQLILICPAALITTELPKIIAVLVRIIHFTFDKADMSGQIVDLQNASIRCLSSIYPLVNVITSTALLTPVFSCLDHYGWSTMSFARAILRSFINTKNRDGFGKPGYLYIVDHIVTLLPALFYEGDSTEDEFTYYSSSNLIEMTDFTITAHKLRLLTNILLYVQTIFNETRLNTFFHIQHISEVLTALINYTLVLAVKHNINFPLIYQTCRVEDIHTYENSSSNEELIQKCIQDLYSVCEDTLTSFCKSIVQSRDFFSTLTEILYIINESDTVFRKQLLRLAIHIVSSYQVTSTQTNFIDFDTDFSSKLVENDPDTRLLWIQFFTAFFGLIKHDGWDSITTFMEGDFRNYLLQSIFMENNTKEHYEELCSLLTCILEINIPNGILFILPVLFYSQSLVVQKLVQFDPNSVLMQYLDSTTITNPTLLKLANSTTVMSSTNQLFYVSTLETVNEGEEDEEVEVIEPNFGIPFETISDIQITDDFFPNPETETISSGLEEIPLVDEKEEQSPYSVGKPDSIHFSVIAFNLSILHVIADKINSKELSQYLQNVFLIINYYPKIHSYHLAYQWDTQSEQQDKYDGKQVFYQKEAIVQFIIRSSYILSSPISPDYTEQLRTPFYPKEYEEDTEAPHPYGLHRYNSVGNGSEMNSFKNSVRDSDSDVGDWNAQHDTTTQSLLSGSKYIKENPTCEFAELMKRVKMNREGKEGKLCEPLKETPNKLKDYCTIPGEKNQSITLMF